jgi:ATP adenylyltransferase/5',5'''-P-1,P-4-tetraphosphate phosphorylase II
MEELIKIIEQLNSPLFDRIFDFKVEIAKQKFPEKLKEKITEGEEQKIFIFKNKILNQETHFNIWRAKRKEPHKENVEEITYDPFCNPKEETPIDNLGRLENDYAITASNLAKISPFHSLVIFKKHRRRELNFDDFYNGLILANEWFQRQPFLVKVLIFNYGLRAGASISHPHFQIFSLENIPSKIQDFYEKINEYKKTYNSDYLEDFFKVLNQLNLAKQINNLKFPIKQTPFKDKEIIFWNKNLKESIKEISLILDVYKELSENFNMFLIEFNETLLGYLVDRGKSSKINSDIGALEIYAFSVVGFDLLEFSRDFIQKLERTEKEFQILL